MADSSISSNKSAKKRKVREDESAPNDDDRERSNSIVSSVRSSGPARNKPPKSTAQLFIDSMNSMQDKFMNQIKAEQTASTSGNVTRSLDYLVLAVRVIRKMKNIDRGFLFKALDLFKDQPQTAKIFVILESEELRIGWLKYQFEKLCTSLMQPYPIARPWYQHTSAPQEFRHKYSLLLPARPNTAPKSKILLKS
ncbi:uncharacterized protein MELLADRAFT_114739 [Melampsora larici-populina 98AG31]|uniref:Uncharacterized protein n=1 Tax=Melampsora larici-populina (strain 98AG31 / pathotype 3-4-7) TaxID=747676 RepID=F4SEK8_MELLP|nr:uncharacterized protein MELLADRAFT_114739 [Melampsora larici-populina 98AG31]EGF96919.1 hypothetical protein MELLADRAFT_114739 [Melampsora larici-populina 98AG31]